MTKDELVEHMESVLAEVISQDIRSWRELGGLLEKSEIELDKAYHHGYASAIETVKEML